MIAGLIVMLVVGIVMGVTLADFVELRPLRARLKEMERQAGRAQANARNWERVANRTMVDCWSTRIDADNADHSKSAELRAVVS